MKLFICFFTTMMNVSCVFDHFLLTIATLHRHGTMDEDATITGSTKLPLSLQRGIRLMSEQIWFDLWFSYSPKSRLFHDFIVFLLDIIFQ